jgi:hypothetical protein
MPAGKRKCAAINARGKRCEAPPLKDDDFCSAHSTLLPDEARFGSSVQAAAAGRIGGAATRHPRPLEILREKLEESAEEFLAAYVDALTATRPVQVGYGEDAYTEHIPDHAVRMAAADKVYDRVFGKPRQATELTGAGGGPIGVTPVDLRRLSTQELTVMAELLERAGDDDGAA